MYWYCARCGCELSGTSVPGKGDTRTITVDGCHCGLHGIQDSRPKNPTRDATCPAN